MECFGNTDFGNKSRLITLSAIIISGLHCIFIALFVQVKKKKKKKKKKNKEIKEYKGGDDDVVAV
jgi:uncharacterized membrane protein